MIWICAWLGIEFSETFELTLTTIQCQGAIFAAPPYDDNVLLQYIGNAPYDSQFVLGVPSHDLKAF